MQLRFISAIAPLGALAVASGCGSVESSTPDGAPIFDDAEVRGADASPAADAAPRRDVEVPTDAAPEPEFRLPDSLTAFCTDSNTQVSCPTSGNFQGQDGDYRINVPEYEARGDVVFDTVTLLSWTFAHQAAETLGDAEAHCADLASDNLGDLDDWRVPSRYELMTLFDYGNDSRMIPAAFASYGEAPAMWTSTPFAGESGFGWLFNPQTGFLGFAELAELAELDVEPLVRCVSGELPERTFEAINSDAVFDTRTRLTWQRALVAEEALWRDALAGCEELELDGHDDWRLPNAKEMMSIVADTRTDPAFSSLFEQPGGENPSLAIWTSTPVPFSTTRAFIILIETGIIAPAINLTRDEFAARCVRGP